jgi:hypothetical protein
VQSRPAEPLCLAISATIPRSVPKAKREAAEVAAAEVAAAEVAAAEVAAAEVAAAAVAEVAAAVAEVAVAAAEVAADRMIQAGSDCSASCPRQIIDRRSSGHRAIYLL